MYFKDARFKEVAKLLDLMGAISEETGKSRTQIAINWLLCKDVIPIPGVRNASQVEDIRGACNWRLSDGQVQELDDVSARIPSSTGAPFEKW
jgi:pyridoxine 4-dehydrogenase